MRRLPTVLTCLAALGGAALLTACGSGDSSPSPTAGLQRTAVPAPTAAGLPFHYEAQGESSGPSFRIDRAATYPISYELKGSTQQPGCNVTIAVVADDGTSRVVVPGIVLQPSDTKQGSVQVQMGPGNWRFQEGGGCFWSVTVAKAG
jgi:hypothetical protein